MLTKLNHLLTCPLTQQIFREPVTTDDGTTFERSAIESWFQTNDTNPLTKEKLASKTLIPNRQVQDMVVYFRDQLVKQFVDVIGKFSNKDDPSITEDIKKIAQITGQQIEVAPATPVKPVKASTTTTTTNDDVKTVVLLEINKAKICVGDNQGGIRVWNIPNNSVKRFKQHYDTVLHLVKVDKNRFCSGGYDGVVHVFDTNGNCLKTMEGKETNPIAGLRVIDENRIIGVSGGVYIWNLVTADILAAWEYPISLSGLELMGTKVVTSCSKSDNDLIRVLDLQTGNIVKEFQTTVGFFTKWDNNTLCGAQDRNMLAMWNIQTGQCTRTFLSPVPVKRIIPYSLPQNQLLSGHEDGSIRLWDVSSGTCIDTWKAHLSSISGLQMIADSQLVSGDVAGKIRLWHNNNCVKLLDNEYQITSLVAL